MPLPIGGRIFFFRAFRTGWKSLAWRIVLFLATLCHLVSLFTFATASWGLFCLLTVISGPLAGYSSPEPVTKATQFNLPWQGTDLAVLTGILKVDGSSLSTPFEILEKTESLLEISNSQVFLLQTSLTSLAIAIGALFLIHSVSRYLSESLARKAGSLFFLKLKISPGLALKNSENLHELLGQIAHGGYALLCLNQPFGFIFVFSTLMTLIYYPAEILVFTGFMGLEAIFYRFLKQFYWLRTIRNSSAMKLAASQLQGGAPVASFAGPNWIWNNSVKFYLESFTSSAPYSSKGLIFLLGVLFAWLLTVLYFSSSSYAFSFFVIQDFFFLTILIALLAVSALAWVISLKYIENGVSASKVLLQLNEGLQNEKSQVELAPVQPFYNQIQLDHFSLQHPDGNNVIEPTSLIFQKNQIHAISGLPKGTATLFSLALAGKFPYMGELRIDNVNLRRISTTNLSALIGIIPQDGGLLPGSIKENLAGGYFDHSISKVLSITKEIRLHKVISLLPEGYGTKIIQGALSPLHAFLLGLAREVIQSKSVLIMEPPFGQMSHSDEKMLLQILKQIGNNRIVFVFNNAPYLLKGADRIVVFQSGNLEKAGGSEEFFQTKKMDHLLGSAKAY